MNDALGNAEIIRKYFSYNYTENFLDELLETVPLIDTSSFFLSLILFCSFFLLCPIIVEEIENLRDIITLLVNVPQVIGFDPVLKP